MDILTTRVLSYADESGGARDLVLTIFVPYDADRQWKCGFALPASFPQKTIELFGVDFFQALLSCLEIAPQYLRLTPLPTRAHWQGMHHSGLLWRSKRPEGYQEPQIPVMEQKTSDLDVLATRKVAIPDQNGVTSKLVLTVYKPTQMDDGTWKCAYSFHPLDGISIRFGTGADYIEAILDALTLARVTYDSMIPHGWRASKTEDLLSCDDLPYKSGRSYFIDLVASHDPAMPDFTPS